MMTSREWIAYVLALALGSLAGYTAGELAWVRRLQLAWYEWAAWSVGIGIAAAAVIYSLALLVGG